MHAANWLFSKLHTKPTTPPSVFSFIRLYLSNKWFDLKNFWHVDGN